LSDSIACNLRARGWYFYKFIGPDVYRLMCSWATRTEEIEKLIGDMLR